jgi:hypothetical protein
VDGWRHASKSWGGGVFACFSGVFFAISGTFWPVWVSFHDFQVFWGPDFAVFVDFRVPTHVKPITLVRDE